MINEIFNLLDDWRNLPAYQLERRADIFFAVHLPKIFKQIYNVTIDVIIPEFPVRVGEVSDKHPEINKSFKIDYVIYSKKENIVYFAELKTDQRSRRDKQDWYLESAAKIKIKGLIEGLLKIYQATNQKTKYMNLLNKVEEIGWIKKENRSYMNIAGDIEPTILYIQPHNSEGLKSVISFDDVIKVLSDSDEDVTKRFIKSLEKWKQDTNK